MTSIHLGLVFTALKGLTINFKLIIFLLPKNGIISTSFTMFFVNL